MKILGVSGCKSPVFGLNGREATGVVSKCFTNSYFSPHWHRLDVLLGLGKLLERLGFSRSANGHETRAVEVFLTTECEPMDMNILRIRKLGIGEVLEIIRHKKITIRNPTNEIVPWGI